MIGRCFRILWLLLAFYFLNVEGFQQISTIREPRPGNKLVQKYPDPAVIQLKQLSYNRQQLSLFVVDKNDERQGRRKFEIINRAFRAVRKFSSILKQPKALAFGIFILTSAATLVKPDIAQASAPVMALPKAEGRDPASEAVMEYDRRQIAKTQQALDEMTKEARRIEAEQGEDARIKFENEFKERQQKEAEERAAGLVELKRKLLDEGICPFVDLEGQRQVILYSRGVDLGKVPGTQFNLEKEFEKNAPKRSMAFKKAVHRKVLGCMVQDMKNRGIDPLDYFGKHQEQTEAILDLPVERAAALLKQYEANLEEYGQILPPREEELSVKEKLAMMPVAQDSGVDKAEAARIKAEEKAKAKELKAKEKEEKARLAAEARELKDKENVEKARLAAEAKAAKKAVTQAAKKAKEEQKAAIKDAESKFKEEIASIVTPSVKADVLSTQAEVSSIIEQIDVQAEDTEQVQLAVEADKIVVTQKKTIAIAGKEIPVVVAGGGAVFVLGGGGIAFKLYKDQQARDEEQRQRQLRLLMGGDKQAAPAPAPALEEIDVDFKEKPEKTETNPVEPAKTPASEIPVPAPKKRRLGLKNVFAKKKNERETDLSALVGTEADAPEFAKTLAKTLTFGAPGRFPNIVAIPGGMPMEKFELEEAKQILIDAQTEAGLSLEDSAEIFANVVNCMLIDIVDLASASLKEKDEKITVDAINVVVDFMNHAASLYDSIAEGVTITPVTYGGDLSKSKLEQMYSSYAVSGMMNMDSMAEDFDNRVAMLQDVFQINEKKAEGLMMKAMQKNMMKMMKDGEGMEGMEEMLKGMGGIDGMPPGMGGMDGDGPSPEQLKEMLTALKEMKESGSIPKDEFNKVKKQFNDAFGSSIDDVVKEASANNEELSQTDKELLELMKSIMKD